MTDTSPAIESMLRDRYAQMTASERVMLAITMFETAQRIVLSSLPRNMPDRERSRELCRRFYGEDLARKAYG